MNERCKIEGEEKQVLVCMNDVSMAMCISAHRSHTKTNASQCGKCIFIFLCQHIHSSSSFLGTLLFVSICFCCCCFAFVFQNGWESYMNVLRCNPMKVQRIMCIRSVAAQSKMHVSNVFVGCTREPRILLLILF